MSAVLLLSFLFYGCSKFFDTVDTTGIIMSQPDSKIISPDGSFLSFMNGNVTIDAPAGAVSYPVDISVEAGQNGVHNGLITKMIYIRTEAEFNRSVSVTINCKGDLQACPWPENCELLQICCWKDPEDFSDGCSGYRTFCTLYYDGYVEFCIEKEGVFAVGTSE